jgi:hypothetical protein
MRPPTQTDLDSGKPSRRSAHSCGMVRVALRNQPSSGAVRTLPLFCTGSAWSRSSGGRRADRAVLYAAASAFPAVAASGPRSGSGGLRASAGTQGAADDLPAGLRGRRQASPAVSRMTSLCGNVHRAGLTGRPHACIPPGLRCSRRRFLGWDADKMIQGSSVDHDLCCDNEACRRAGEVACWVTTEVAARSGNPRRGPSAGQTGRWAGAEGGFVRLAPG